MDFAAVMKAELEKNKKKLEEAKSLTQKKWARQGELAKAKEEAKKRTAPESGSEDEVAKKAKKADGGAVVVLKSGDAETGKAAAPVEGERVFRMSANEVIRQLRDRNEPIRLFGETDMERIIRLQYIKTHESAEDQGYRNDFMDAIDKVNEKQLQNLLLQQQQDEESIAKDKEKRRKERAEVEANTKSTIEKMFDKAGKGDFALDRVFCMRYIQYLMMLWEEQLDERPPEVANSQMGKRESAIYSQSVSYMEPLFTKLKTGDITEDIIVLLTEIIKQLIERNYIQASDMYLRLAIGNAPWPIGVTMVGIHARTGREKIFSQHVAHVLNDETQRKYIQALKRLMTFSQKMFPADPSKCLEYKAL
eukprot:comp23380_c0_seq1/m.38699 comp23380_c0_seq1/g.38699  ORF comp23380_c0_seq1/g.38699 comp23380_c0_seq1/m.38699 type:complete len:363 (-) comp23380_c0_seq1:252-1340(-)